MRSKLWQGNAAQKLCKDYQGGAGIRELGRKYHASSNTIHRILRLKEINIRPTGRNPKYGWKKEELEDLYLNKKLTATEIGNMKGVSEHALRLWLYKYSIPLRTRSDYQGLRYYERLQEGRIHPNLRMNKNLTYILGVLLGDGYAYKNNYNYKIGLSVSNMIFAKSFAGAITKIGLHPHIYQRRISQKNPNWHDQYSVTTSCKIFYVWYKKLSPRDILTKIRDHKSFIVAFLRGFYESEGTLAKKYSKITLFNSNPDRITLVRNLLHELNFKTTLTSIKRPNKKEEFRLYVLGGKVAGDRFLKTIKPCIKGSGD